MAKFAIFFSYTPQAWAAMISEPSTDRAAAARTALESVGGSLEAFYWMLGDRDGLVILDAPSTEAAAAGAAAVYSSGAFREVHTVPLIDPAEQPTVLEAAGQGRARFLVPGATASQRSNVE